ncbi:MAG: porin [Sulfurovum sp.]|nr:porin [Sulfurovum sp.]
MSKRLLSTLVILISTVIQAENINLSEDVNITLNENTPIKIKSVRGILGENDLIQHKKGQLRAGYITFSEDTASRTSSYALAGHYHVNTQRWNGLLLGAEAYTVLNMGINQNPLNVNSDFFDANNKSSIILSKAFLDGKWGNTEIKLGRQIIDTPHSDSDDIRMMPNYFEAYTLTNTDISDLTLTAGFIDKMAGWENGSNSADFIDVGETLGSSKIDGITYASASYEGFKDLSLSLWYYHYSDIADVLYMEAGYSYTLPEYATFTFGLQYDASHQTGATLLGQQDANTYGISIEAAFTDLGVTFLAAYNQDNGETGATSLSLGGGPFFTSMEDQTLDVLGSAGSAWMMGAAYDFGKLGVNNLTFGLAYGKFETKDASLYSSQEIDTVLEYNLNDKISITAAFALVDFKENDMADYNQFRLIANYNF